MPRGIVITKVAPAVEKVGEIETAAYEVTMPASSAIALDAYNNAEHAEVTKKRSVARRCWNSSSTLTASTTVAGGRAVFYGGAALRQRRGVEPEPFLAHGFSAHAGRGPVWQCRVLRTHLYDKNGADFA